MSLNSEPVPESIQPSKENWTLKDKLNFFGQRYFSSENYGVPGGYESYDNDGFWQTTLKTIEKHVKNPEDKIYLDLGCAFGHLLKRVPFKKCYGGDISWEALRHTQKAVDEKDRGNYTMETQLDAEFALPFENESFDCVTALDVVEHTHNFNETMSEISRVIKSSGLFIVGTPITDTVEGKVWGKVFDKDKSHFNKPTRDGLFKALEQAGFEVSEYHYYFPLPTQKIPFPRTNMEIASIKTNKTLEQLRLIHQEKFKSASFLNVPSTK
jgi:SAM-dependent methyltransferase